MFREYVIEPTSLSKWEDIRYLLSIFGWEKGRPITQYPNTWKRMVFDSLQCSTLNRQRVIEKLRRIKFIERNNISFDRTPWLDNALRIHTGHPFEGIISVSEHEHGYVIKMSELDEDDLHSPTGSVKRKASKMADAVKLLLQTATTIKFIDPHFDPFASRFKNVMTAMLSLLSDVNYKGTPKIELYTSSAPEHAQTLCGNIHKWMTDHTSIPVSTIILPADTMHNRYIISDKSGAMFGTGLDEATGGNPDEDRIFIISHVDHKDLSMEYSLSRGDILYKSP